MASLPGSVIERITELERNEAKNTRDILQLQRENYELRRIIESAEERNKRTARKSGGPSDGAENSPAFRRLKQKCDTLQNTVNTLQEQVKAFGKLKEDIDKLDKMAKIMNKAMIQSHEKKPVASTACVPGEKDGSQLRTLVNDLQKWRADKNAEDGNMLNRIRAVARETACIEAMKDQITELLSWKEEKETMDKQSSHRLEENMKKINANFSAVKESLAGKEKTVEVSAPMQKNLQEQLAQSMDSIFCADLGTERSLAPLQVVKVNKCSSAFKSSTGPFDSKSGTFKPQYDGAYNLGWKIHQKGDGKIRFIMAIEGMRGRIYLGSTDEAGGICSGTLIMPLKKEQRVWIEAKRVAGPDAQVYGCNFMGWLMELNFLGSLESITSLQQSLFSAILDECQHL